MNKNLKIITIIAMMFLYAMIAFVTNLAAPVGKIWEQSFEGSAHAGIYGMLGNFCNFLAYLIMGIPAGNFLAKFGYKKTALTAIMLGLGGIAVQWISGATDSFAIYLIGALICGFCVCMLNTVTNPMLNLLGGGGKKGNQLNMIGGTLNSLSGTLTPMLVGMLVGESVKGKEIDDVNVVLYIAMKHYSSDGFADVWRKSILRIWGIGFICDLAGAFLIMAIEILRGYMLPSINTFYFPGATIIAIPGVLLSGVLIYRLDRVYAFKNCNMEMGLVQKLSCALSIFTAPYAMLIPLYG